ncbi:hypothetical protein [Jiella mangrovi]|uniref:Uncharacterized protein n=1 Tax=Jiella mangrovi TaxID=2821407 RepID=A0ABS4BLC2_9HYPH|nr:hypothetical protein [Jiella mangrovi]MBP0617317.1 hypothetical protein [Jiella mangrovi]
MLDEQLRVQKASADDIFSDIVRIPEDHRVGGSGGTIRNGAVIRIEHKGRKTFAIVRGLDCAQPIVQMDEFIRDRLCVKPGEFIRKSGIRLARWYEKPWWLLFVTNPTVHVSAWLAVISVGLGALSIFLALC